MGGEGYDGSLLFEYAQCGDLIKLRSGLRCREFDVLEVEFGGLDGIYIAGYWWEDGKPAARLDTRLRFKLE